MSSMTRPVLLLVSGTLCDARVWDPVASALRDHADVRTAVPWDDSIAAMARSAWAGLDDVPAGTPLVLAGFSLGGYVVQEMLARPPQQAHAVNAVALIATSPRPESPEGAVLRGKMIAALTRDFPRAVEGILQVATHVPPADLLPVLRGMMLEVGADVAIRQNRAAQERSDHRAALAALRQPVTVLCGAHDRVTPFELSRELAALIPQARLERVDDAGHMLPRERPEAVVRALRDLLDQLA